MNGAARCYDQLIADSGLPRGEARVLLEHISGRSRSWLIAHGDETPNQTTIDCYAELVGRRRRAEPMAYLVGSADFLGREFKVNSSVLIPRPETGVLARYAIESAPPNGLLLELGCGSGALCVTIACARPDLEILATDIDPDALAVARDNAKTHHCTTIRFAQGDWFEAVDRNLKFHLIVSNPPYVANADPHLARDGLPFEPPHALRGGDDGLDAIRTIAASARTHLASGGSLAVEHGYDQQAAVGHLLEVGGLGAIWSLRDEAGHWRVSGGGL